MPKSAKKSGSFSLPYFKQGDDMQCSLVKDLNDKVDAKASINNHIALLQNAINMLEELRDALPNGEEFDIYADTHSIDITGNRPTIEKLVTDGILYDDCYDQETTDSEAEGDEEETSDSEEGVKKDIIDTEEDGVKKDTTDTEEVDDERD